MYALGLLQRRTVATSSVRWELGQLVAQYSTFLLRYAVLRLGEGAEAEDAVAETFAAAMERLAFLPAPSPQDAGDDPTRAYLVGIARRKIADILRRRGRESSLSAALLSQDDPAQETLTQQEAVQVRALLASLPELYREVLLLKYAEDMSLVEIGLALNKSPNAVGQLLHRARKLARTRGSGLFIKEALS